MMVEGRSVQQPNSQSGTGPVGPGGVVIAVGNGHWNGGVGSSASVNEHSAAGPKPMWGRGRGDGETKERGMTHETTQNQKHERPKLTEEERKRLPLELGFLCQTPGVAKLDRLDIQKALGRHASGDWGDLCRDDWKLNNSALTQEDRILSSYTTREGVKFWIITECDRSATTVLLPDEY